MPNIKLEMNGTTPKQRRVAVKIAEDVLRTMRYLNIEEGCYFDPTGKIAGTKAVVGMKPSELKGCHVCAIGAMFASRALLMDGVSFPDSAGASGCIRTQIQDDIGKLNAGLIESAFETIFLHAERSGAPQTLASRAVSFGLAFADGAEARLKLRAIMKNVIANKGVFRP
jgi:hypothetical protein